VAARLHGDRVVRTRRPILCAGILLGALVCCAGIREDELLCEEAMAHIGQCCPGLDVGAVDCTYTSGCQTTYPALTVTQSQCIDGTSCPDLVSSDMCPNAQAAQDSDASSGTGEPVLLLVGQVCP
jgi:hypothetical protein